MGRHQHLCRWSDNNLTELASEYENGVTMQMLSEKYGCSIMTISNTLHRAKAHIRQIRHKIYDDYFSNLDTPAKCYWFGFLAADGYAKRKNNHYHFVVRLKEADEKHLCKLRTALGSTHPIKHYTRTGTFGTFSNVVFELCSERLVTDLNEAGLYDFKVDGIMPAISGFESHFWRGFIDGDGWICFNRHGRNGRWPRATLGACGIRPVLLALRQLLHEKCGANMNSLFASASIWRLQYAGGEQIRRITDWLYADSDDAIRLDRKYNKYIDIKEST